MSQPVNTSLLALLLKAYNKEVKDFFYFPDFVMVGRQRIEPQELQLLKNGGYLQQTGSDSFGRIYKLSVKAENELFRHLAAAKKQHRKKKVESPQPPLIVFEQE